MAVLRVHPTISAIDTRMTLLRTKDHDKIIDELMAALYDSIVHEVVFWQKPDHVQGVDRKNPRVCAAIATIKVQCVLHSVF